MLDVPYFFASAGETHLRDASGPLLEGCLAAPPIDRAIALLDKLSPEDCDRQVERIRSSVRFPVVRVEAAAPPHRRIISDAEKTAWAVSLGEVLLRDAACEDDGSLSWLKGMDAGQAGSERIDAGLYQGTSGLAFFFAALFKHTNTPEFRTAAERAIAPVLKSARMRAVPAVADKAESLGLANGLGSVCYTLTRLAAFLSDRSYLEHALALVWAFPPEAIAADAAFDLMGGSAGAIVGLIALYEATDDPLPLELSELCARHLLDSRRCASGPHHAWVTNAPRPQVGFSHGASGVAPLALERPFVHSSGLFPFREAIRGGLELRAGLLR